MLTPGRVAEAAAPLDPCYYRCAHELTLVQRGSGERFVGDHTVPFAPGDLVLVSSDVPHHWSERGPSRGLSLQWHLPEDHAVWQLPESASLRMLEHSARGGIRLQGLTAEVTRSRMERLPALGGLRRLAMFIEILDGLATAPKSDLVMIASMSFTLRSGIGSRETRTAVQAQHFIRAHYREMIGLQELLSCTCTGRATFTRRFRRGVGMSFSAYLNHVRLQAVRRALRETSESISRIALDHGFTQLSFFNRLFRRELGMSPSEYRLRHASPPGAAPFDVVRGVALESLTGAA